MMLLTRG